MTCRCGLSAQITTMTKQQGGPFVLGGRYLVPLGVQGTCRDTCSGLSSSRLHRSWYRADAGEGVPAGAPAMFQSTCWEGSLCVKIRSNAAVHATM